MYILKLFMLGKYGLLERITQRQDNLSTTPIPTLERRSRTHRKSSSANPFVPASVQNLVSPTLVSSPALLAGHDTSSRVALCYIGALSILRNPTVQAHALEHLVNPLNATVFMHIDLSPDLNGLHKDLVRPAKLFDSELVTLHQRFQTASHHYSSAKIPPLSDFKCKGGSLLKISWFVEAARQMSPMFEHSQGCLSLVRAHEIQRGRPFEWIIFSRTDSLFLHARKTSRLLEMPQKFSFVDVTNSSDMFKIGGRVQVLSRERAEEYVRFVQNMKQRDCEDMASVKCKKHCAECLLTKLWLEKDDVILKSSLEIVPFSAWRACGTQADCTDVAKHIRKEFCQRTHQSHLYNCKALHKYYSGSKRPTIYGTA